MNSHLFKPTINGSNFKTVLFIAFVVIVFVFSKNLLRLISSFFSGFKSKAEDEGYIAPDKNDKYALIAHEQHEACYMVFGTDTNRLFKTLEGLSDSELKQVFAAFGMRSYFLNGRIFSMGEKLNLIQWYDKELTKSELRKMYLVWRGTGLFEKHSSRLNDI
jgi:hypothetical protein